MFHQNIVFAFLSFFVFFSPDPLMSSKEKDDAVDRLELDLFNSGSEEKNVDFRSQCCPEDTHGKDAPWEKHYEKLWVEVEKKELKSTFKNVAGELKEKFGELYKSRQEEENARGEAAPATTSAEEDSSDEEEGGEVIVRPAARARRTVLLPIPEQTESGQEDSVAESPDDSVCKERTHMSSDHHDPELLSSDVLRSVRPQLNEAHKEIVKSIHDTKTLFDGNAIPMDSFLKYETDQDVGPVFIDRPSDLNETDMSNVGLREELGGFHLSQLSLQSRRSDVFEELEEDRKRFKLEVWML